MGREGARAVSGHLSKAILLSQVPEPPCLAALLGLCHLSTFILVSLRAHPGVKVYAVPGVCVLKVVGWCLSKRGRGFCKVKMSPAPQVHRPQNESGGGAAYSLGDSVPVTPSL